MNFRKVVDFQFFNFLKILKQVKNTFTRDQRNHYIFTPKMLSRLIESLKYYPENCFQQVIDRSIFQL